MKAALKWCAIVMTIIALVTSVFFMLVSAKRYGDVTLFDNAKGFAVTMNHIFYPTGYIILTLVFIFLGITSLIFLFGEDRNKLINVATGVVAVLVFFWFVLLFVSGKRFFKKKINGADGNLGDIQRVEKYEKELAVAKSELENAISGSTVTFDELNRYYTIEKTSGDDRTEEDKAWYEANKEKMSEYKAYIYDYRSTEDSYIKAKKTYDKSNSSTKVLLPYFLLSFTALVAGATQICWVYTKEEE